MKQNELLDTGWANREKLPRAVYAEKPRANVGEFTRPMRRLVTGCCRSEFRDDETLPFNARSMPDIGMSIAMSTTKRRYMCVACGAAA